MTALLWKDYRLNRHVLGLGVLLLLLPYAIFLGRNLYLWQRYGELTLWAEMWLMTAQISCAISLITVALLGGNAVASERVERSGEFLAYLPPTRAAVVISKAGLALAAILAIWLVNVVVAYAVVPLAAPMPTEGQAGSPNMLPLWLLAATTAAVFGCAWLASTMVQGPGLAAGTGILLPAAIAMSILAIDQFHDLGAELAGRVYLVAAWLAGLACFVGGTLYYLRRIDP
jgi:ABC-type transport system involved in multi-copper enzyme maturation permease subunit